MRRLARWMSYVFLNVTASVGWLFTFVLNRTSVVGRENVPLEPGVLIVTNHVSIIDSFLVAVAAWYPRVALKPWLFPWHPAAKENFFRGRFLSWCSNNWRCIPVRRGEHDFEALAMMEERLQDGMMLLFPEGTRTRSGRLGAGRPGVGKLIHDTRPIVIPAAHVGMDGILPIKAKCPRVGQRLQIAFGEPIDFSDLFGLPSCKETSQLIASRVMAHIAELRGGLLEENSAQPATVPGNLVTLPSVRRAPRRVSLTPTASAGMEYPARDANSEPSSK